MKVEMSRKDIMRRNGKVVCLPYDEGQFLLVDEQPFAYNAGKYGWNFDAYDVNGVTFVMGDRPPDGNTGFSRELLRSIVKEIRGLLPAWSEESVARRDSLLSEFTDSIHRGIRDPEVSSFRDFKKELHRHVRENPGKDIIDCSRYVLGFADNSIKASISEKLSEKLSRMVTREDFPTVAAFEKGDRSVDPAVAMYMGKVLRNIVDEVDARISKRQDRSREDSYGR